MRALHFGLRVSDPDRSVAFYQAVGYRVVGRVADTPIGQLTMLRLPDDPFVSLELVHDPATPLVPGSALSHFVVQVDSLAATLSDLAGRGIAPETSGPQGADGPRTAHLRDPDGHLVELVEWPAGHPAGLTEADWAPPGGGADR